MLFKFDRLPLFLVNLLILTVHLEVDGAVAVLVKDPEQLVQVLLTCCALANKSSLYTGCPKKNALSELCGICVGTKFFGYFGYFEQASLQPSF